MKQKEVMKRSQIGLALLSSIAALAASPAAHALGKAPPAPPAPTPNYSALLSESVLGPVAHTAPRDQGDAGFCWAYSLTGYMEGEALKAGKHVQLSPEYVALNHIPKVLYDLLPKIAEFNKQGLLMRFLIDALVLPRISPEGASSYSEGLGDLDRYGVMPETAYNFKYPTKKDSDGNPVASHPTLAERIILFTETHLTLNSKVEYYIAHPNEFREDVYDAIGSHPPGPSTTFVYEGKTYTPLTFMKEYVGFNPSDYQEVAVADKNFQAAQGSDGAAASDADSTPPSQFKPVTWYSDDQAYETIKKVIQDQTAVPITYMIFEDQRSAQKSGVFSPDNCVNSSCQMLAGGHAVLATGLKVSANASVDAFIVKNSWDLIGLDDSGQSTADPSKKGFFLITRGYMTQAEHIKGSNGWSFLVQKKYLPASQE